MARLMRAGALALALLAPAFTAQAQGPERIVSLDGSATEIVYMLGMGDKVVATDITSTFPPATRELPKVGYVRALAAEGVIAQRPDLVLMPPDAKPDAAVLQIADTGVTVLKLPDAPSAEGVGTKVRAVAAALGKVEAGEQLAADIAGRFEKALAFAATAKTRPRVLFLLDIGKGAPMAGGAHTSADAMIRMAGGINAASDIQGFRPMAPEGVLNAAPDVILMMQHSLDALGGPEAAARLEPVVYTPAGRNGQVIAMEGLFLLGFGPRTPEAVTELARALHPDLPRQ